MEFADSMQTPGDALSYIRPMGYGNSARCGYCGRQSKIILLSNWCLVCRRWGISRPILQTTVVTVVSRRHDQGSGTATISNVLTPPPVDWTKILIPYSLCALGYSFYATATSLRPDFYQSLLDKSWRRSGSLLYRPNPRESCCPHYTLRLDSQLFKPTKDQRQAINRFNKFVVGDAYAKEAARRYPLSRDESRKRDTHFELAERLHEAEADRLRTPLEPQHNFTVTLERDDFTEEKYQLYENYQRTVHHESPDEVNREGFRRFLCDSPLRRESASLPDGREKLLGSFHQCYRLDGQLVAIGVLDLLPQCVSAVYYLYHEDIHSWSPGKLGALREIALAQEDGYRWWYPGFYIHSCPKMRYKIDYSPQYILDPESLAWDLLDPNVLALLDQKPYVSLSRERRLAIEGQGSDEEPASSTDDSVPQPWSKNQTVFTTTMPGIHSFSEILALNMDHIALKVPNLHRLCQTSDLVVWDDGPPTLEGRGLKNQIAELVATVGIGLMDRLCLDYSGKD